MTEDYFGKALTKMCFSNGADYRGCNLVNARYDRRAK